MMAVADHESAWRLQKAGFGLVAVSVVAFYGNICVYRPQTPAGENLSLVGVTFPLIVCAVVVLSTFVDVANTNVPAVLYRNTWLALLVSSTSSWLFGSPDYGPLQGGRRHLFDFYGRGCGTWGRCRNRCLLGLLVVPLLAALPFLFMAIGRDPVTTTATILFIGLMSSYFVTISSRIAEWNAAKATEGGESREVCDWRSVARPTVAACLLAFLNVVGIKCNAALLASDSEDVYSLGLSVAVLAYRRYRYWATERTNDRRERAELTAQIDQLLDQTERLRQRVHANGGGGGNNDDGGGGNLDDGGGGNSDDGGGVGR